MGAGLSALARRARVAGGLALVVSLAACTDAKTRRPAEEDGAASTSAHKKRASATTSGDATVVTPLPRERLIGPSSHVVVAGVLSWGDRAFSSFDAKGRKDRELAAVLEQKLGVPTSEIALLIDDRASRAAILDALRAAAKKTRRGETLVFYYAGHGTRGDKGEAYLAPTDVDSARLSETGLSMPAIEAALAELPQGSRALLFADSCFSGALGGVASSLSNRGVQAAAITSAEASNTSTVNWTFTQTLIEALRGDPIADHDKSGGVTLAELGVEAREALKARDRQRAGVAIPSTALAGIELAEAPAPPAAPAGLALGQYVSGDGGVVLRVVGARGGDVLARGLDYATVSERAVPPAGLRPIVYRHWDKGAAVDVEWGGRLWDAHVKDVEGDFMRVGYDGWPVFWDEWVLDDRVKGERTGGSTPRALPAVGDAAQVEWHGRLWAAHVLAVDGKRVKVHYDGYEASWDEWVGPERLGSSRPAPRRP